MEKSVERGGKEERKERPLFATQPPSIKDGRSQEEEVVKDDGDFVVKN